MGGTLMGGLTAGPIRIGFPVSFISLNLLTPDILNGLFMALLQAALTLPAPGAPRASPSIQVCSLLTARPAGEPGRVSRIPGPPRSARTPGRPGRGQGQKMRQAGPAEHPQPSAPPPAPRPRPRSQYSAGRPREAKRAGPARGSGGAGPRGLRGAGTPGSGAGSAGARGAGAARGSRRARVSVSPAHTRLPEEKGGRARRRLQRAGPGRR